MCVLVWCPKRQPAASSANPSGKERDQEITRDLPLMEPAVAFEISHSSSDPLDPRSMLPGEAEDVVTALLIPFRYVILSCKVTAESRTLSSPR